MSSRRSTTPDPACPDALGTDATGATLGAPTDDATPASADPFASTDPLAANDALAPNDALDANEGLGPAPEPAPEADTSAGEDTGITGGDALA